MGMNPESGRMEPLMTKEDVEAFQKAFTSSTQEKTDQLQAALESAEIELADKSLIEMELDGSLELLSQRGKGECPIFQEGEVIPLRGGAFKVERITETGLVFTAVKDVDL